MSNRNLSYWICGFFVLVANGAASATVYRVKTTGTGTGGTWATACSLDYALAHAGITPGANDSIWVMKGTYGPITINNRAAALKMYGGFDGTEMLVSRSKPLTNVTIITGGSTSRAIGVINTTQPVLIRGFHIQDSIGHAFLFILNGGGGVYVENSSPLFVNCVFANNYSEAGGAVGIYGGSPTFVNCVFKLNGYPTIPETEWTLNGGAVFLLEGLATFHNCLFYKNKAYQAGAVLVNSELASATFVNCTFSGNIATVWYGGAVYDFGGASHFRNCILWGNTCPDGTQISTEPRTWADVRYSDVQGGLWGTGNINVDPSFVNPGADDYRLNANSPCVNAGTSSAPALPNDQGDLNWNANTSEPLPLDLDMSTRVWSLIGTPKVDMGPYEHFEILDGEM